MITRFDHAVIGVRDLQAATHRFERLGFTVAPGGRHSTGGTHNAIVRFGLDYLELMAVADASAAAADPAASSLLAFLSTSEGGLIGFALAASDLDALARRLSAYAPLGPLAMSRQRPDGRVLAWRLLIPGGMPWLRPWPFLIEWRTPDADRLAWDGVGAHPNGARRVRGIDVATRDLDAGRALYADALGLAERPPGSGAFSLGDVDVRVRVAASAVEQPLAIRIHVADLDRARALLGSRAASGADGLVVDPAETCGAQVVLVA